MMELLIKYQLSNYCLVVIIYITQRPQRKYPRDYLRHWWQRSRTSQTQLQGDSQILEGDQTQIKEIFKSTRGDSTLNKENFRADLDYPRQPFKPLKLYYQLKINPKLNCFYQSIN